MSVRPKLFVPPFKNSTAEGEISFDDLVAEIKPIKKSQINREQLSKMVERFNYSGLKELLKKEKSISITTLKWHSTRLARLANQRISSKQMKQVQQQEELEQAQKKQQIIKTRFNALIRGIKESSVLNACGQVQSREIDQSEINKVQKVEELKTEEIRNLFSEHDFAHTRINKIKKDNFVSLFQISPNSPNNNNKKRVLNFEQFTTNLKARQRIKNIRINVKKRQLTQLNPQLQIRPKIFSVILPNPNPNPTPSPRLRAVSSKKVDTKNFPLAKQYYRNGTPPCSDYIYLQELQSLLGNKKIFLDNSNPESQGTYTQASQILSSQYQLFNQSCSQMKHTQGPSQTVELIQANDIKQGSIGDCYFMSAIASLASSYPQLLSERFLFHVNPAHYNCVKLFIDGQWKYVKTDDRFACNGGEILYTKPNKYQIWVMLLQKSYAKFYGSYAAIDGGKMRQSFLLLTGAPQQTLTLKNEDQESVVKQIFQSIYKGYILGASSSQYLDSLGTAAEEQFGLVANHAYSLLSIHKIRNQIVLRLRNPWGRMVWKGAWSQQSKQWTRQLKNYYMINYDPNDGSFFIGWKDFEKFYDFVSICKLNPTYLHSSLRMMNNSRKSNYITLKIRTNGTYNIFICQQNPRKAQKQINTYSNMRLILAKKHSNGDFQYLQAQRTQGEQLCIVQTSLQKGTYFLSAKVAWKTDVDRECFLTCYGTDSVTFKKSSNREAISRKFKEDLVISFSKAMKSSATIQVYGYDSHSFKNVFQETCMDIRRGIGFVKIINKSQKEFYIKKIFTMTNMKIIKPKSSPYEFNVSPGKEEVIGFFLLASGYSYLVSETLQK